MMAADVFPVCLAVLGLRTLVVWNNRVMSEVTLS